MLQTRYCDRLEIMKIQECELRLKSNRYLANKVKELLDHFIQSQFLHLFLVSRWSYFPSIFSTMEGLLSVEALGPSVVLRLTEVPFLATTSVVDVLVA